MEPRAWKMVSFVVLVTALAGIWYGTDWAYDRTWEDTTVGYHSIWTHSLGVHQQGDEVRVRILVDEGSVRVLEGREVTIQLLDSENRGSMEQGEGYLPLEETVVDTQETDEGSLAYEAHRTDTYYLAIRNEDWWNITLRVADGEALDAQLFIRVFAICLAVTTVVIFAWMYGRLFDVPVRRVLGLVRRDKGPGSRSAREPEALESDVIREGPGMGP